MYICGVHSCVCVTREYNLSLSGNILQKQIAWAQQVT